MKTLEKQRVVVVGGASGIGLAVAAAAAREGALVDVHDVDPAAVARVKDTLPRGRHRVVDILDEAAVVNAFDEPGPLDHVYVAAGFAGASSIVDGDLAAQWRIIDVRLKGSAHVVRAASKRMRPAGSFTLTGGVSTDRPAKGSWAINVSTAATEQLTRTLAVELAPLRFNAVAPGWTDTPMWDRVLGPNKAQVFSDVAQTLLTKRLSRPDEVAEAVLFLMRTEAITGEVLHVDGGGRIA
ncbi:MAG: SDR family oxidoreductase [Myxococcaceae bacterium]|nr:SDR family oxidoreductase [Myxococcaceae bacterium]